MADKFLLLVEDNPDDVELTIMAFAKAGIQIRVQVARDGAEALGLLFGAPGKVPASLPEIVLLDLNLPRVSGIDVLARIRANERTKLLPVIILTTSDEEKDRQECYRLGASSYIIKPVEFAEFNKVVKRLGEYWLSLNAGPGQQCAAGES